MGRMGVAVAVSKESRPKQVVRLLVLLLASALVTLAVTERSPEPEGSEDSADCDARLLLAEARVRELQVQVEELQAQALEREAGGICLGQQTPTRRSRIRATCSHKRTPAHGQDR